MQRLTNKRILLGITGGIAAYKSAELVRALKTAGADVRVVMTDGAKEFITPLTLQALSGNPVHHSLLDPEAEAGMGHIELARWADFILVAPASANFIARVTAGMGNDLLTTLLLASNTPKALAPAMNQAMWAADSTQANIQTLSTLNKVQIWGPDAGEQACGDVGPGRMLEPLALAQMISDQFESNLLTGKTVTITAGPTREAIDPVRYISNHSSGKMGFALAIAAVEAGAKVNLITGPVNLATPERIKRIDVESCQDMLGAVENILDETDIFIGAAAVADYRPANVAEQKIKKSNDAMNIELVKNPDIIATVAAKDNKPFTVGFAAETQDVIAYAKGKLEKKNLDMIVANDVSQDGIGFNSDQNAIIIIDKHSQTDFAQASKYQLANDVVKHIAKLMSAKS
jgi:phosphopantothenoylcysteine decarboxylase/phosphopantothenate--cysteine ligase